MSDTETEIEQTVRISARRETVWNYWTDPARMCEWWGATAELDARPGGACIVGMNQGPVMRGEFLEVVPHERLVFTFGWDDGSDAPAVPPGSTRVEVTLTDDGDDTILSLRHTGLPPSQAAEHDSGWGHFLGILAEAVPAGTAAR